MLTPHIELADEGVRQAKPAVGYLGELYLRVRRNRASRPHQDGPLGGYHHQLVEARLPLLLGDGLVEMEPLRTRERVVTRKGS